MLRYLRVAAAAGSDFAQRMHDAGSFTFAASSYTAATDRPVPREVPAAFIAAHA